jgi:hypothetical protein
MAFYVIILLMKYITGRTPLKRLPRVKNHENQALFTMPLPLNDIVGEFG